LAGYRQQSITTRNTLRNNKYPFGIYRDLSRPNGPIWR
jgi:hypothetical protein